MNNKETLRIQILQKRKQILEKGRQTKQQLDEIYYREKEIEALISQKELLEQQLKIQEDREWDEVSTMSWETEQGISKKKHIKKEMQEDAQKIKEEKNKLINERDTMCDERTEHLRDIHYQRFKKLERDINRLQARENEIYHKINQMYEEQYQW